ncbi:MAG TPA: septum formation inhibitor [Candidatus Mediterraneibacter vanvlietii]|nr:septum formation inhibitor [Candidatus Mediterraneibacter vanvlietii]
MDRLVTIRSSKYGLDIELDPEVGFDVLLKELMSKFRDSARFFKDATMALSFSGRSLSRSDEDRILKLIQDNTRINILCIIERNEKDELMYKSIIDRVLADSGRREGQVYRGTLRRGQILESEGDIVILGDVELGACVVADGSVIIVGNLYGSVSAGASGDSASYVVAVSMQPKQLRIAGIEAKRQIIYQESLSIKGPKIAVVEGRHIYLDPLVE